ncbi:RHS repeat domain-containing protein [Myroides sp. LJL115]
MQKKVTQGTSNSTTDYLNGFQYVDNVLSFVPTSEGFFDFKTNKYVYQYVDQLGNVRLSYSDKDGNNKIETAEIIEQINYYPFGLAHKGYNEKNDPLMKDFKYQYNGKENQEELGLNVYDYGARNYDAAIGRWMNVDPLAEKYYNINPYVYVANNPINAIDPDGRDIIFVINKTRYKFDGTNLANAKGQTMGTKNLAGTHAGKVLNAYIEVGKLDNRFQKQIQTLVKSKNEHIIDTDSYSYSGGAVKGGTEFTKESEKIRQGKSVGSITNYNFSEENKKEFFKATGVINTEITTVAHELSHQYDYETGNMQDSYDIESSNTDPTEIRAVRNENIARDRLDLPKRTKYDGKEINPKELK